MATLHSCPTCGQQTQISESVRLLLAGEPIEGLGLSPTERTIVSELLKQSRKIEDLADVVYSGRTDPPLWANEIVRVAVCRLRKKLGTEVLPVQRGHRGLQIINLDALQRRLEQQVAA